ncbi:hypothetical protein GCM10007111_20680 [Virgibacillus kapii]|uniref:Uncharacterized protein n=1 Tax=Virgibacillus kapii TaxID=1638645 RepID=A0ABQ2DI69_9BACI|nr:hypothetical protein GCM10007111_20680 [Virgibacillus kapii]
MVINARIGKSEKNIQTIIRIGTYTRMTFGLFFPTLCMSFTFHLRRLDFLSDKHETLDKS